MIRFIDYNNAGLKKLKVKRLYKKAFPKEERAPYGFLKRCLKKETSDFLVALDGDEFVGMVYMVGDDELAYIFYLAIDEKKRAKGYGSAVLTALREKYADKRIFLAREMMDENADNYEQRKKRHEFYLKNGYEDIPATISEAGVTFDTMSIGGMVTHEEYDRIITAWAGRKVKEKYDLRLDEK